MRTNESGGLTPEQSHDLRDPLAITKGWLEILFRNWDSFPDAERRELVAAALLGANRMCLVLDVLDGTTIDITDAAAARMADEFMRVAEESAL